MCVSGETSAPFFLNCFFVINNSDEVTMKAVHQFMGNSQITIVVNNF